MYEAMKKIFFLIALSFSLEQALAQAVSERLRQRSQEFQDDPQLTNATFSLYVINGKTGEVVFDRNARVGLATASTLKIITAATAYELLGPDFRYETRFGYTGKIRGRTLQGDIYIRPSGDPTLGSWRWKSTSDSAVMGRIMKAFGQLKIAGFRNVVIDDRGWDAEQIPDGWIRQDIGNYYGAGPGGFNWRENQFDIVLRSGKQVGDRVSIVKTDPKLLTASLSSAARSAGKGTGDNAYLYYPLGSSKGIVRGTIPVNENNFVIAAAQPAPKKEFSSLLVQNLSSKLKMGAVHFEGPLKDTTILLTEYSPTLDSIVYWFLKKSINLYGEALTKTMAYQQEGLGSTEKGVEVIKNFWKEKGIPSTELNMADGSGLSPLNRITAHAQVTILAYAKRQPWFSGYYNAFPEYNGMKMKSGTISDVKSFCGYQQSKDGNEYIFSFLVNNYNGSASSLVQKMYKVLNELK
jgi:D-alanyl-D-alanine carboxypeptidase/D-alanyl-D-alanine-endopeptidase (penicillin-binding protein 4)